MDKGNIFTDIRHFSQLIQQHGLESQKITIDFEIMMPKMLYTVCRKLTRF